MSEYIKDKSKILVVDDVEINRIILDDMLSDMYDIEQASDGMEAYSILINSIVKPDLVLLDVMMPDMNGFEVLELMKANSTLSKIPVIFITAAANSENRGLYAGAVDYISKPFDNEKVILRVANHIELSLYRSNLEKLVEEKANELIRSKENFLETMADLIEYRSLESGEHVRRTKKLAGLIVNQLLKTKTYEEELVSKEYKYLIRAVPLHDIGKIGIPDEILLKPGKLTDEEFEIMKTHSAIGSDVIKSMFTDKEDAYLNHCYDICRSHHEKWDGSGYPDSKKEFDIPLSARIVAIVDVYDALVSERCYKKSFSHEKAMSIIVESSGSHFDPVIVTTFIQINEQFEKIYMKNR
jgi:putative two-component system response regulator